MIHGYHAIFGAYGFWLPNDPRGSWSDFVGAWELFRFGKTTKSTERFELTPEDRRRHQAAKNALKYPAVQFSQTQILAIARGFANAVTSSRFGMWACAILPEHVHVVVARHRYSVEQIVNLLKGAATKQLAKENLHPLAEFRKPNGCRPSPWADRRWKIFLDHEEAIENAIRYVEENPAKEGYSAQSWVFVQPFSGLGHRDGWVTYE